MLVVAGYDYGGQYLNEQPNKVCNGRGTWQLGREGCGTAVARNFRGAVRLSGIAMVIMEPSTVEFSHLVLRPSFPFTLTDAIYRLDAAASLR